MKSPLSIKYEDLIREAEYELTRMERDFPGLVQQQRMPDTVATKKIVVKKKLIAMLKKQMKVPQLKLWECFEKTR